MGLTLERARREHLGSAIKVVITKDSTIIVTDGSTQNAAKERIALLKRLVEVWYFIMYKMKRILLSVMSRSYQLNEISKL